MLPMFAMMTIMPGLGRATEQTFQFDAPGDSTWDKGIQGLVDSQCTTQEGTIRLIDFCYSLFNALEERGLVLGESRGENWYGPMVATGEVTGLYKEYFQQAVKTMKRMKEEETNRA